MRILEYNYARQSGGRYPRIVVATPSGLHWPAYGQAQKDLSVPTAWSKPLPDFVHVQLAEVRPNGQWTEYVHAVCYNEECAKPVVVIPELHGRAWPYLTVSEAYEAFLTQIDPFTCTFSEFQAMLATLWKEDAKRLSETEAALEKLHSVNETVTQSFTLYQPTHKIGWKCATISLDDQTYLITRHTEAGFLAPNILIADVFYSPGHRGGTYDFTVSMPAKAVLKFTTESELQEVFHV